LYPKEQERVASRLLWMPPILYLFFHTTKSQSEN
jgi:hypothetical protein